MLTKLKYLHTDPLYCNSLAADAQLDVRRVFRPPVLDSGGAGYVSEWGLGIEESEGGWVSIKERGWEKI